MYTVYPTKMKAIASMHKQFNTKEEAMTYLNSRTNPDNYTLIEPVIEKQPKPVNKSTIDFSDAVQITKENVKYFYGKSGFIQVKDMDGNVKHVGKTTNMGKVFSNYINCKRYNQSYDFNIDTGEDLLMFKEAQIKVE